MVIESINKINWTACFDGLNPTEMVEMFTNSLSEIFSEYIPNKVVKFDDRDPPWMKRELKTALKRKHRIYAKFVRRGRKQEDWDYVKRGVLRGGPNTPIPHEKVAKYRNTASKNCQIPQKVGK